MSFTGLCTFDGGSKGEHKRLLHSSQDFNLINLPIIGRTCAETFIMCRLGLSNLTVNMSKTLRQTWQQVDPVYHNETREIITKYVQSSCSVIIVCCVDRSDMSHSLPRWAGTCLADRSTSFLDCLLMVSLSPGLSLFTYRI